MAPLTQNGEKEFSTGRVEAIRLCSCALAMLLHQWGWRITHSLTHSLTSVYVMKILCVVGCVSKYV
jgi:hypothetical protein